ncbi:MAG TPA: hypothetical protein VI299_10990, partial [Polyangiales bacterium]
MDDPGHIGIALAYALLAGPWTRGSMRARAREAVSIDDKLATYVVRTVLQRYPAAPRGRAQGLANFIAHTKKVAEVAASQRVQVQRWFFPEPAMARPVLRGLSLPELRTWRDVAALTGLEHDALAWFADPHRYNRRRRPHPLRHYHYRWLKKRSGAYR